MTTLTSPLRNQLLEVKVIKNQEKSYRLSIAVIIDMKVKITNNYSNRSKGFWRLNTSFLNDPKYI